MAFNNWRWWQWLVVSIFVGAGLGLVFTMMDQEDLTLPSISFSQMRGKVERTTDTGESLVTGIRVGPVMVDGTGAKVQAVTFYERQHNRVTGKWDPVVRYRTVTPVPLSTASPRPDFGVLDYLADMKKRTPTLDWKFQWWLVPRTIWIMCLGGSVLVIGVIWPILQKTLVKLGLAEPPSERMGSLATVQITDDSSELPTGAVVTNADRQQLADLNAELAANVAGMTVASGPKDPAHVDEPIRLLQGDKVTEVVPAVADKSADDFKGEFYPVARPTGKK